MTMNVYLKRMAVGNSLKQSCSPVGTHTYHHLPIDIQGVIFEAYIIED